MNWLKRLLNRWRVNRVLESDGIVEIDSVGRIVTTHQPGARTSKLRDSRGEY